MVSKRAPRRDGLPEFAEYVDTGCSVSPSCLQCPLEVCRYDMTPAERRQWLSSSRDEVIVSRFAEGHTLIEIAAVVGVSKRTAARVLARRGVARGARSR